MTLEEEKKEKAEKVSEEATTIGMFLKYTRMKQKKSIEAVSDALCIRKIYIKALEEDDYETLEPIPYGVGFVRSYASYLGLNAERIAQVYKQQAMPQKEKPTPVVVTKNPEITRPTKRQIYIGLASIAILYVLWLAFSFIGEKRSQVAEQNQMQVIEVLPVTEETDEYSLNIDSIDAIAGIENNESENALETKAADQITVIDGNYDDQNQEEPKSRVLLKVKGDSWIELKDKNKVYLSGVYKKGYEYTAPDVEGLILSIGRYYNVDVYIDGELTKVATPKRQTKIQLDRFLKH